MGDVMRSRWLVAALAGFCALIGAPSVVPVEVQAAVPCFGDCNASSTLTASDIGRINATILRCGPCPGAIPGGVATGCAALANGCTAADFNSDGCLRASELARANQNILKFQPSGCATTQFTIGTASGAKGSMVSVAVNLAKNGTSPVTVAPLRFGFDSSVLTFNGCTSTVTGKIASWGLPSTGSASVVDYDDVFGEAGTPATDLTVFPDGTVLNCSFTIAAGAASGATPLTFVSAPLADAQFNDFPGVGTSGSITVL